MNEWMENRTEDENLNDLKLDPVRLTPIRG